MTAPATAMAGAAFPAISVAFPACDGVVCRPVRLTFTFRPCLFAEFTGLLTIVYTPAFRQAALWG
jgi:hypothetical protein